MKKTNPLPLLLVGAVAAVAAMAVPRLATGSAPAPQPPAYDAAFWQTWGDGMAELAAYDLRIPRYGEVREGRAVAIVVSEEFSDRLRVKADPGNHPQSDRYPVLKLNLVQDFQTGIYDYNTMTSAFVQLAAHGGRPAGALTKVSFGSQEWCGQTYSQLVFDKDVARLTGHSYFDGEADQMRSLVNKPGGLEEDVLWLWARGLAGPVLARGESREVPFLPALLRSRFRHEPLAWTTATLEVLEKTERATVPAGTFEVEVRRVTTPDGLARTFRVETTGARRVVDVMGSDGYHATLRGSDRMKYWQLHGEGQEAALARLGLPPPGENAP